MVQGSHGRARHANDYTVLLEDRECVVRGDCDRRSLAPIKHYELRPIADSCFAR